MGLVFNVHPGDVFWAASDVGWVVGHSYIVYGPLLHGCSTVLYEGKPIGTPDAGAFWRVCQEYNVRVLSTAPTALRALKREDPHGKFIQKYPMPNLQALFLAGERCDPDSLVWAQSVLGGRPVIDNWWMTELGSVATGLAQSLQTPTARPGSCGLQMPGFNFALLDEKVFLLFILFLMIIIVIRAWRSRPLSIPRSHRQQQRRQWQWQHQSRRSTSRPTT